MYVCVLAVIFILLSICFMHHSPVIEFLLRGNDVVRSAVIEPLFPLAAGESDLSV